MRVCRPSAQVLPWPAWTTTTSNSQMVSVRPDFFTRPVAISFSPRAGATRLREGGSSVSLLRSIRRDIQAAKERDPKADTTALEREIDRLVYDLYDLTTAEIAVVEESTRAK